MGDVEAKDVGGSEPTVPSDSAASATESKSRDYAGLAALIIALLSVATAIGSAILGLATFWLGQETEDRVDALVELPPSAVVEFFELKDDPDRPDLYTIGGRTEGADPDHLVYVVTTGPGFICFNDSTTTRVGEFGASLNLQNPSLDGAVFVSAPAITQPDSCEEGTLDQLFPRGFTELGAIRFKIPRRS